MGNIPCRALTSLLLLTALAGLCHGEQEFNVHVRVGWDGCHRPQQWLPIDVTIATSRSQGFSGELVLSAQQDAVTRMEIRHPVTVSRQLPIHVPLVSKLSVTASECRLSLVDEKGRAAWSESYSLMDFSPGGIQLTPVRGNDVLIGTSGTRSRVLAQFGTLLHPTARDRANQEGALFLRDKPLSALPWDWTGYACLDVLVLSEVDWTQLRPQQVQAVADHVHSGGTLLLVPGQHPWPTDGPAASLVPFAPASLRQDTLAETNLAGGRMVLHQVSAWPLAPPPSSGWQVAKVGSLATFAHGPVGFGQVGVLAFDPARVDALDRRAEVSLWQLCLERLLGEEKFAYGASSTDRHSFYDPYVVADQSGTNAVLEHLLSIPQLRPLNIWFVVGLLALLALMLGPIDYFLLKKLDRLPWTWVTSTCIIAAFTAAAYYGVKFYRSGDLQVRAVSVIDSVHGQGTWATVYAGIFAPDSDDYRLDGLAAGQWWAAISPMRDEYAYMSPSHLGGRSLYCRQGDGANLPVSLPISIYSMQCLLGESKQARTPLSVKADAAGGSVTIEVTNHLAHPAKRILVWHDKKSWEFPALAGEATTRLVLDRPEAQAGRIHATVRDLAGAVLSAQGVSRRTQAIARYRDKGAVVVLAEYDQPPLSHTVQSGRCGRDHILLARVVVPLAGGVKRE